MKRVAQEGGSLVYNPVDKYLLEKMGKEVKHLLSRRRVKIHGCDKKQPLTALDVFACALPPAMSLLLKEWMVTADEKLWASQILFDGIIAFIVGEISMRVYQMLSGELNDFDLRDGTLEGYSKARQDTTNADRPAYL